MNVCSRGHRNGMFEDIEPDGTINLTCVFCGECQPTGSKMHISAGSPVYIGSSYSADFYPLSELEPERPAAALRVHSEEQVAAMEAMWRQNAPIRIIAEEFGMTEKAAYGVLRRRMGDDMRKYNSLKTRVTRKA